MSRNLVSDVADMAVAARSSAEFRRSFINLVGGWLCADHSAYFCMDRQRVVDVVASDGQAFLVRNMPRFLEETTPVELQRALAERTIAEEDMYETARTGRRALYQEFLQPNRLTNHVLRMWPEAGSVHWFAFGFASPHDWTRSAPRTLAALDEVFPVVALVEDALAGRERRLLRGTEMDRAGQRLTATSRRARETTLWVSTMLNRAERPRASTPAVDNDALHQYSRLARRYRLTETELQWAVYLATHPSSLRRAAEHFGVTMNTAKTHVKRIYEKTHTHRQSELMKLVIGSHGNRPDDGHGRTLTLGEGQE